MITLLYGGGAAGRDVCGLVAASSCTCVTESALGGGGGARGGGGGADISLFYRFDLGSREKRIGLLRLTPPTTVSTAERVKSETDWFVLTPLS